MFYFPFKQFSCYIRYSADLQMAQLFIALRAYCRGIKLNRTPSYLRVWLLLRNETLRSTL